MNTPPPQRCAYRYAAQLGSQAPQTLSHAQISTVPPTPRVMPIIHHNLQSSPPLALPQRLLVHNPSALPWQSDTSMQDHPSWVLPAAAHTQARAMLRLSHAHTVHCPPAHHPLLILPLRGSGTCHTIYRYAVTSMPRVAPPQGAASCCPHASPPLHRHIHAVQQLPKDATGTLRTTYASCPLCSDPAPRDLGTNAACQPSPDLGCWARQGVVLSQRQPDEMGLVGLLLRQVLSSPHYQCRMRSCP